MTITKKDVAAKIAAYLNHQNTLAELVDWSERALMDEDFAEADFDALERFHK